MNQVSNKENCWKQDQHKDNGNRQYWNLFHSPSIMDYFFLACWLFVFLSISCLSYLYFKLVFYWQENKLPSKQLNYTCRRKHCSVQHTWLGWPQCSIPMLLMCAKWGLIKYQIIIHLKYRGITELLFSPEEHNSSALSSNSGFTEQNMKGRGKKGVQIYGDICFMWKHFSLEDTNKEQNPQQPSSPLLDQKKWQHYIYVTTAFWLQHSMAF